MGFIPGIPIASGLSSLNVKSPYHLASVAAEEAPTSESWQTRKFAARQA
jgi:hypothetical protein